LAFVDVRRAKARDRIKTEDVAQPLGDSRVDSARNEQTISGRQRERTMLGSCSPSVPLIFL